MNYRTLVNLTLLLTYVLILVGGATRVFEAGVSCPDWPQCYGLWWPWPESRVFALNHLGYVVTSPWFGTRHFTSLQVALEWGHRLMVGLVSAGIAVLVLGAAPSGQPRKVWTPLSALMVLFIIQISLGAITVWLGNIHWSVALHLGTAMAVFGSLVWLRRVVAVGRQHPQPVALRPGWSTRYPVLACTFAAAVWLTMVIGGVVSSSHAGGVCGGLFACAGQWWPTDAGQRWHMLHRLMALTTFGLSIALLVASRRANLVSAPVTGTPFLPHLARRLHVMVLGQVALGIATLYSFANYPEFYPLLSLAHLAWGTLVWLAALGHLLTLMYGPVGRFHQPDDLVLPVLASTTGALGSAKKPARQKAPAKKSQHR